MSFTLMTVTRGVNKLLQGPATPLGSQAMGPPPGAESIIYEYKLNVTQA